MIMGKKRHISLDKATSRMRAGPSYHRMSSVEKLRYSRGLLNTRREREKATRSGAIAPPMDSRAKRTFRCTWCGTEVYAHDAAGHAARCAGGTP